MTYVQFTILVPEGNDFREIHYHLMDSLGFQLGGDSNTLTRPHDAAIATWEAIPEEALYDGLQ